MNEYYDDWEDDNWNDDDGYCSYRWNDDDYSAYLDEFDYCDNVFEEWYFSLNLVQRKWYDLKTWFKFTHLGNWLHNLKHKEDPSSLEEIPF